MNGKSENLLQTHFRIQCKGKDKEFQGLEFTAVTLSVAPDVQAGTCLGAEGRCCHCRVFVDPNICPQCH